MKLIPFVARCLNVNILLLLAVAPASWAANFCWDARSGLWPHEVNPGVTNLFDTDSVPILTPDYMLLATPPTNFNSSCVVWTSRTNISMPTQLVVEAEVLLLRNAKLPGTPDTYPPPGVSIHCSLGTHGIALHILTNRSVALVGGGGGIVEKVLAEDTTTSFHRYRIEIDNPTILTQAVVRVYFDDVLEMTGTPDPQGGAGEYRLYFGDPSSLASGAAYWRSIRHNAAATESGPIRSRLSINASRELRYWAQVDTTYQLQVSSSLAGTNEWMNVGGPVAGDDSMKQVVPTPSAAAQQFYRLNVW